VRNQHFQTDETLKLTVEEWRPLCFERHMQKRKKSGKEHFHIDKTILWSLYFLSLVPVHIAKASQAKGTILLACPQGPTMGHTEFKQLYIIKPDQHCKYLNLNTNSYSLFDRISYYTTSEAGHDTQK